MAALTSAGLAQAHDLRGKTVAGVLAMGVGGAGSGTVLASLSTRVFVFQDPKKSVYLGDYAVFARAATIIREGGSIPACDWDGKVIKVPGRGILEKLDDLYDTMVICATNRTRVSLNGWIRQHLGFTGTEPMPREKVICLKNNKRAGVFNGQPGVLETISRNGEHQYNVRIRMDGIELLGLLTGQMQTLLRDNAQIRSLEHGVDLVCRGGRGVQLGQHPHRNADCLPYPAALAQDDLLVYLGCGHHNSCCGLL